MLFISNDAEFKVVWQFSPQKGKVRAHASYYFGGLPAFLPKRGVFKALRRNETAGFILEIFFDNLKSKQYSASILNMNFLNYSKEY